MSGNLKENAQYEPHPANTGVFLKHFFGKGDNDRLNNLEVLIVPGCQIAPHKHDAAGEYFYVVSGEGEFMDGDEWLPIAKGSAFKAPMGVTHAVKNTGKEPLLLLSTFSPPTR